MEITAWQLVIQFGMLITASLSVGMLIATRASKGRERIIDALTDHHKEAMEAVIATKKSANDKADAVRIETGEAIKSIRQQITDLGFFIRDNYVREKEFVAGISIIRDSLTAGFDKVDARCLKIEAEIKAVESEIRDGHNRNR